MSEHDLTPTLKIMSKVFPLEVEGNIDLVDAFYEAYQRGLISVSDVADAMQAGLITHFTATLILRKEVDKKK